MKFIKKTLNLSRPLKVFILIIIDISIVMITSWLAVFVIFNQIHISQFSINVFILCCLIYIPVFLSFRIYNSISRFFSFIYINFIFYAVVTYSLILNIIVFYSGYSEMPISLSIVQPLFFLVLVIISRIVIAYIANIYEEKEDEYRTLIYGAGIIGARALELLQTLNQYKVIGFIDKDLEKVGRKINGFTIYNDKDLKKIIQNKKINKVVIAINNFKEKDKDKILFNLNRLKVHTNLIDSKFNLEVNDNKDINIRKINLDDLIDHKDFKLSNNYSEINNSIILVSGAGGSIGSELIKQIIKFNPKRIILLDHSEYNLYRINHDVKKIINNNNFKTDIIVSLVSICNKVRMEDIFSKYKPDQVFHTAAYKHVNIVEINPNDSIINNVLGTKNIVDLSKKYNVKRFLFISTDKAVRPSTLMGKTKRLGEKYIQAISSEYDTKTLLSIVRFGNVMGSSGSVIPLFIDQIESGGPVTLTHKDIKRYFMSANDAVSLVLEASQISTGGEIFLLDMGEPVKIYDLAVKMINLSGKKIKDDKNRNEDIEIKITELDKFEKLSEELIINADFKKTSNSAILEVDIMIQDLDKINKGLNKIENLIELNDQSSLLKVIDDLVN